jgi:hypothetical protein
MKPSTQYLLKAKSTAVPYLNSNQSYCIAKFFRSK